MRVRIHSAISLLLLLTSLHGPVRAQSHEGGLLDLPDAPAWQHARAFIEAFESGDPATLSAFLSSRLSDRALEQEPLHDRIDDLMRLRAALGSAEVIEVSGVPHALIINLAGHGIHAEVVLLVNSLDTSRLYELRFSTSPRNDGASAEFGQDWGKPLWNARS